MRVAGIVLVVVLAGLVVWIVLGGARGPTRSGERRGAEAGLEKLGGAGGAGGAYASDGSSRTGGTSRPGAASLGAGGPTIVRASEPATFTALPGDGPISEAGPGDVTNPYPPSRVTYVTTPVDEKPGGDEARVVAPPALPSLPAGPPADGLSPKGPDRTLDRAIEGDIGPPPKSDEAPGQYR